MCSINDRNTLTVYEYFINAGEDGAGFIQAVQDLKQKGVFFGAMEPEIEPFLIILRDSDQIQKIDDEKLGGTYRITSKGERQYSKWREYAGEVA